MRRLFILFISPLVLAFTSFVSASDVMVEHPYARATPPNTPTSAVFVTFVNGSDMDKTIVSASTPAANKVELHTHTMEGDVMKMRRVDGISIPANGRTELKPGGLHIMLFDLQRDFSAGEHIDVTVQFADGETQTFTAEIKKVMQGMMTHKH